MDGVVKENVYGTYVHGIFDADGIAAAIVQALADKKGVAIETSGAVDYQAFKEKEYDKLADTLRQYLDMDAIYQMMEKDR